MYRDYYTNRLIRVRGRSAQGHLALPVQWGEAGRA